MISLIRIFTGFRSVCNFVAEKVEPACSNCLLRLRDYDRRSRYRSIEGNHNRPDTRRWHTDE